MQFAKTLIQPCKLLFKPAQRSVPVASVYSGLFCYSLTINVEKRVVLSMSQRSITSFFSKTPKKSLEQSDDSFEKKDTTPEKKPRNSKTTENGHAEQKPTKRQRLVSDSESNEPEEAQASPPQSDKKKRTSKRQRIESTSSEASSVQASPVKETIKVVKSETPKTYSSPKSKKVNNKKTPAKDKNDETSDKNDKPKVKSDESLAKKAQVSKKNSKQGSTSPVENKKDVKAVTIKTEKTKSPLVERNAKVDTKKEKADVKTEKKDVFEKVAEESYDPSKAKYHPVKDACWSRGEDVPYLALARTLEAIEATSSRLKIVDILSNYLRSVIVLTPEDLLPSIYMCLNQLAPAYHSLELGIAETYLMKAIGQCTGRTLAQVKAAAQKTGDLGLVAEQARATQKTMFAMPPLKTRKVFATLKEIAHMTGQSSVNKKIGKIQSLYVACRHAEARYLIRSLAGKLRVGLAEQSVLQALAVAVTTTPPGQGYPPELMDASRHINAEAFKAKVEENALIIKTTYCECPNYEHIIPVILQHGVEALPQQCKLTPGLPLKPMLAHPTKGLEDLFNRFDGLQFTCEWKYDGERAQIHVPEGPSFDKAAVYSRNQEDNSTKYPDILSRLPKLLKSDVMSCVLDCEAVAYDVEKKQILPFQILSTRKRKDAKESDIKVQVCVFVFDLLYLNGRALVKETLRTRRELMKEHFNEVDGEWQFATSKDCSTMDEVQQFLEDSIKGSCEGLMVKTLEGKDATYEIAKRSHNWLKLKKDYLDGVGDTIDVVVIGGYIGKGRRTGIYGGFLLACYDPDTEEFQSICKIGTGFSDDNLQQFTEELNKHLIDGPRNYYSFDSSHAPDAWFSPAIVWEVRCADLSLSPAHRAAMGRAAADKGVSLRFPRFIRVRDDKGPEQATSAHQIAEMYLAQDQVKNTANKSAPLDDFY